VYYTGFVGGDAASFVNGKGIKFTSDEIEILGEGFLGIPHLPVKLLSSRYDPQERWCTRAPSMT